MNVNLIVILGPTASGKTRLSARLAKDMGAEIISADSRQVYRGMDMGTGKDLSDYLVDGTTIPYHLIDIVDPDYEFNVFDFQQRFFQCFIEICNRSAMPLMVGGTGLYIDAILRDYRMRRVPEDPEWRNTGKQEATETLVRKLQELNPALHNTTDILDRKRLIRAIEIAEFSQKHALEEDGNRPLLRPFIIGIRWERTLLRQRITDRLKERLAAGMIEEVETLHRQGIGWERLDSFGLEYRYIGLYLQNRLTYDEMLQQLNTKIQQFAKRQETWFRRMERKGMEINWLNNPDYEAVNTLVKQVLS